MFGRATIRLGIGPHSIFGLAFCVFFCFSLDYFVIVLFTFVVLDLVSSALCQKIGWEERL